MEFLNQKTVDGLSDNNSVSRYLKGPFHYLLSKDHIKEDKLISTHEIIEAANEKPMILLVIGKPRSGKSWTGKDLSIALDLVHITVEWYLTALEKKIAAYEPPTDLEEG